MSKHVIYIEIISVYSEGMKLHHHFAYYFFLSV
jgi:hypothetical protein